MKQAARDPILIPLMLVFLAWLAAQTVTLGLILARIAVLEDRVGVSRPRTAAARSRERGDVWAGFQLMPIPDLLPGKDKKQ